MIRESVTDCRSEAGITVGLLDALLAVAAVLAQRDMTPPAVQEALRDVRSNEHVWSLLKTLEVE